MTLCKPAVFLLAFVTCQTLGLRLTNYATIDKQVPLCELTTIIPNSPANFTFLLPGMVFDGNNGTLDSVLALIPKISAGKAWHLVIGIWRDNGNDTLTLKKALVDQQVAVAGLLNVTFSGIFLANGDAFGLTFADSPPVCAVKTPASPLDIKFVHKSGSIPIVGETLPAKRTPATFMFAIAADITPVTDLVPTDAVTTDVTTDPSVVNTTAIGSTSFETSQFALTSTTPSTLSGGLNISYLCQSTTNPCDPNSICEQTLYGIRCVCKEGYEKISNTSCTDIDECKVNDGASKCQQICQNIPGGYTCSCRSGFLLANDSHHCTEQNMCTVASAACKENFTCHSAGGFLQCLPSYVRLGLSAGASSGTVSMLHVDVPQTVWVSNVWVIVFIVWSGLLSVLVVVLIAWMAHEMRQTKIAIEMEINQDVRLPDSTSLYSGSTLRHGMRFHDGTFTAMKSL